MPEDNGAMYETGDSNPSAPPAEAQDKQDESGEETTLIPKSMLGADAKVGDECKFRVVHLYEDEAEIEYVKSEDKKEPPADEMGSKIDEMGSMNESKMNS